MKFDYFHRVNKVQGIPCTYETFIEAEHEPEIKAAAKNLRVEGLAKEVKQQLKKNNVPIVTWQASFANHQRSNRNAIPSGLYMLDFDEVEDTQAVINRCMGLIHELAIVYIARSIGGKGVRVVAECQPQFTTLAEVQAWAAEKIGEKHDAACKDFARASYLSPEEYVYFMDATLFSREPSCVYSNPDFVGDALSEEKREEVKAQARPAESEPKEETFDGIPVSQICEEWLERTGGQPKEGERNTRLHALAWQVRYILGFNVQRIINVIPHCGLPDEEIKQLVTSAVKGQRANKMPRELADVIDSLKRMKAFDEKGESITDETIEVSASADVSNWAVVPSLPPIFREWYRIAPDDFKVPVVLCLLPFLGTLGSRLRAHYLGDEVHSPSFIVTLEATQASGKSFVRRLDEGCLGDLKAEDLRQRDAEKKWKEERSSMRDMGVKLSKQEAQALQASKPKTMVRYVAPTMSVTELLRKMEAAGGLHLFALSEEIDTVYKAQKRDFSNFSDILRKAFDNAEHGQDYASENSWSGLVHLFYNCLYCGTPKAVRRFFPDVEDGMISRVLFVTLPDQAFKPHPEWGAFTAAEESDMKLQLSRLNLSSMVDGEVQPEHFLSMNFLRKALEKWCLEQQKLAAKTEDRTRDTFCRRSAVMGFRAGMLAWFLWGETNTPTMRKKTIEFSYWIANCALRQFLIRFDLSDEKLKSSTLPHRQLFMLLPADFTSDDLLKAMASEHITTKYYDVVYKWTIAGMIEVVQKKTKTQKGVYKKLIKIQE